MNKQESENHLEAFKVNFEQGLDELLDAAEVMLDSPRPPDPASMGFDERTMEELSPPEKEAIRQILYRKLGVDPDKLEGAKLREYITQPPKDVPAPGEIMVEVYKTNREDIFLQELTYPDGEKRWVIGPNQDI